MKKLFILVLALSLMLMVFGCGGSDQAKVEEKPEVDETISTPVDTTAPMADTTLAAPAEDTTATQQ